MNKKLKFAIGNVYIFAVEVVLFWIIWFIYSYAWLNYVDKVSDVLNIILVIGMIIIIVSAILVFIQLVRGSLMCNSILIGKKIVSWVVLITFFTVHIGMYSLFCDFGYSFGGSISIVEKKEIDDLYYFYVKNSGNNLVEIECTKDLYEEIISDEKVAYDMQYRWLTYNNRGVLKSIDTIDFIDNRR